MRWRIYYGDGSTFSDEDGPVEQAPGQNVQVIVQSDADIGRYLQSGHDYYVWREDSGWAEVDIFGLFDYLLEIGLVKFGRTTSNATFDTCMKRALADPDFPPKSHRRPWERLP